MAWRPVAAVAPLVLASCGLALLLAPTRPPGAALALLAGSFAVWGVVVIWLERRAAGGEWSVPVARAVLLGALLLRLPLIFAEPSLSDDVWRYLWDGRVAASGANPYALAPEADELAELRDGRADRQSDPQGDGYWAELWQRLDHRGVPTVYPPVALGSFSIAAATPHPKLAWKGLLTAVELAGCALLLALARRRGSSPARTAWYAWNPLVALEVAGMGHVDGLAVAPMVAAVLWLTPRREPEAGGEGAGAGGWSGRGLRPGLAAVMAAAGALVKLAPLAAVGLWARASPKPWRYLAIALAVSVMGLAPVLLVTGGVPPGLTTYGVSWEFNGPLYEPLWRALDATGADHAAARAADAAKAATGWHGAVNRAYPYLYPQLLAKLLLAAGAAWVVVSASLGRTWTGRGAPPGEDLAGATGRLFGGLLLCSATVYPWYLLWVLPWAALVRHPAWLLASVTAPVVYLAAAPGVPDGAAPALFPTLWLAAWGPPAALALVTAVRRGRGR